MTDLGLPPGALPPTTWEVRGLAWRDGEHRGTQAGPRGLELVPGVSRGTWERRLTPLGPFARLVASLNPDPFPTGSGVRLSARVRRAGPWTPWASLGVYGAGGGLPRSEATAGDPRVAVDLLELEPPAEELALRLELEAGDLGGTPRLRRALLCGWLADPARAAALDAPGLARGAELPLTPRSQRTEPGDLAERGCSPTALATVLAFWGHDLPTSEVAEAVRDRGAGILGNWSFNVAFAGRLGLEASAVRLSGLAALEAEVAAGRPVVISHRYAEGELSDTPLPATEGHLVVVAGFTPAGDPVVCDPAADPRRGEPVRRVYRRAELHRTWLENGGGIAYLVRPE